MLLVLSSHRQIVRASPNMSHRPDIYVGSYALVNSRPTREDRRWSSKRGGNTHILCHPRGYSSIRLEHKLMERLAASKAQEFVPPPRPSSSPASFARNALKGNKDRSLPGRIRERRCVSDVETTTTTAKEKFKLGSRKSEVGKELATR